MAYERVLGEKNEEKKIRLQKVAFKYCDLTHILATHSSAFIEMNPLSSLEVSILQIQCRGEDH